MEISLLKKLLHIKEGEVFIWISVKPTAVALGFTEVQMLERYSEQEDLPCNLFSLFDHLDMLGVNLMVTYPMGMIFRIKSRLLLDHGDQASACP